MKRTPSIAVFDAAVAVKICLSLDTLRERLGELAASAGGDAAAQVDRHVRAARLGYYPALEFCAREGIVAADTLAAIEQVGLFVSEFAAKETRTRLWAAFSRVSVEQVRLLAMTLPTVRPHSPEAVVMLAQHYTPNCVRIDLRVSWIERGAKEAAAKTEGRERVAAQKVQWWLRDAFDSVQLLDTHLLTPA